MQNQNGRRKDKVHMGDYILLPRHADVGASLLGRSSHAARYDIHLMKEHLKPFSPKVDIYMLFHMHDTHISSPANL